MTKANITQYSSTASSNTDIDDINIDENCPASGLNNALRSLMAHLKNVDTGSQALTALSVAGSVTATTSLKTPLIEFTDGDNALTIADGGNVTANADLTVSGALSANGGAVFNEGGADVDFRVESDTIDHALFVNGATGDVGINTNLTPSSSSAGSRFLTVAGSTDGILQLTKNGSGGGALASAGGAGMIFYSHTGTVGSETYTERGRIHSDGAVTFNQRVSINSSTKASSSYAMKVQIASGTGGVIVQKVSTALNYAFNFLKTGGASIGTITLSETATAYNTSSDHRLKENVDYTFDATTRLKQLKPARFNFIADADTTVDGFLAHEVQSVVPEAITGTHNEVDDDGNPVMQGIDQSKLVPLLVKTIQELEARITALENGE